MQDEIKSATSEYLRTLMTVQEYATYRGFQLATVYNAIRDGVIVAVRIGPKGTHVFIDPELNSHVSFRAKRRIKTTPTIS